MYLAANMNKHLIILFFFFNFSSIVAQRFVIKNLDLKKQIPTEEVFSLLKDSKGYIWGSCDGGVFRFNGKRIKIFTSINGLPDNTIFKLFEDGKGRIWMTGYNNHIAYFYKDSIYTIEASKVLSEMLKKGSSLITSLDMDSLGCLFVGTYRGVYKIYPDKNFSKIEIYKNYNDSCWRIIQQFSKSRVFFTNNFFIKDKIPANYKSKQTKKIAINVAVQVITNKLKTNIKLPISLSLKEFNPNFKALLLNDESILMSWNNELFHILLNGQVVRKEYGKVIIDIFQDCDNSIWVSFYKDGVLYYEKGDLNLTPINYLNGVTISNVIQDNEGAIWFSSLEKGIFYCPGKYIYNYDSLAYSNRKILGTQVMNEDVYVATTGNQIFKINQNKTIRIVHTYDNKNESELIKFYEYHGKKYICGYGVGEIDSNCKLKKEFLVNNDRFSGKDMAFLNDSMIWVVSHADLILFKNGIEEKKYRLPNRAKSIANTKQNELLIGTIGGLYSFKDGIFTLISNKNCTVDDRIANIVVNEKGTIYFASIKNGVLINDNNNWIKINEKKGLNRSLARLVNVSLKDEIWTCNNKGISCIKLNQNSFDVKNIENLHDFDGLNSNEVYNFCIRGNEVWIGTDKGLCLLKRTGNYFNKVEAPIYLDKVLLNEKQLKKDSTYQFSYKQNTFTFFIDNLTYRNFDENKFLYRLNGKDTAFKTSTENKIEYQNLLHGTYSLEVISINSSGIKGKPKVIYSFTIQKPFWQTWWFISLDIVFGLSCIWLISYLRVRAIRRKEIAKLRTNQRLSELQLTALRAQMDPHFIFNALSGIQRYVLQKDKFETYDYITKFSTLIRNVLTSANINKHSLKNELDTLKLYVEIELLRFDNGFDFVVNMDESINPEKIIIPNMIIQPFIENAIWHGIMPMGQDIRGQITLSIQKQANFLVITIQDNGIGREASNKIKKVSGYKSYGIELTRNRLDIVNKNIEQNIGHVTITDVKNEMGLASGTIVELKIKIN